MIPPQAIVLSFDHLSRRCLGCYGHEWIETPNLDRLAARAVVFEQHFGADECSRLECGDSSPLWLILSQAGVETKLLVEESEPAGCETTDLETTPFARLLAQAHQALAESAAKRSTSWLLWLNSVGIAWPCVATEEFLELYADELEDNDADEADELKLAEVMYAACVTQLDHLVGRLLATVERLFADDRPLLIVVGTAGESLGESEPLPLAHVDTSPSQETWRLRDELVHTPLLIAHATRDAVGSRRQELVQTVDVAPTLLEWFGIAGVATGGSPVGVSDVRSLLPLVRNEEVSWREVVYLRDCAGHAAMRTQEFLLVERNAARMIQREGLAEQGDAGAASCQLFLKPEDVWELNDVAEQHPEQVAMMRNALRKWLCQAPPALVESDLREQRTRHSNE
ncbi:MAG TPA: sulfatase-like hydrolase/transferase [Planctomycetaceae bacterium]|nr:sulfatase-like hydrolase/transferase [Planctomycetaceae bacterium]